MICKLSVIVRIQGAVILDHMIHGKVNAVKARRGDGPDSAFLS